MMDIPGRIACSTRSSRICPGLSSADRGVPGSQGRNLRDDGRRGRMVQYHGDVPDMRFLRKALQDICVTVNQNSGKVTIRSNGQVVAQVVPMIGRTMGIAGIHAEVWMDPSVSLQNGGIPQASFFHSQDRKGRVCAVLGAGNVAGLMPGDFYLNYLLKAVVALKMNPVNAISGTNLEDGFNALIRPVTCRFYMVGLKKEPTYATTPQWTMYI